jgi:E3 ubiquitin-protein ligase HERC4
MVQQQAMENENIAHLICSVRRDHVVKDTLTFIQCVPDFSDFKKPLKVKFDGEEADDAGGVRKEFFLLLLKEILDPKYGMFKEYEETCTIWFHPHCFDDQVGMFFMIGVLCGLAIYNFTIINLPFPLPLYKKLLGDDVGSLEDVESLSPALAKGLRDLLTHDQDDDDFEEVFCLNFAVVEDVFGQTSTKELKPNGENVTVTKENRAEYVKLYCDYILNKSVNHLYEAFHAGFHKVCGGRVLDLFHARELMALVVGTENYDWEEFEAHADYKNGYDKDHHTIQYFWQVFHDFSEEDKKKFLLFLTGTDRIPILGMTAKKLIIQKTSDQNYLPVAHTCFNLLDLPEYETIEKLRFKLLQAIHGTQGFGLV